MNQLISRSLAVGLNLLLLSGVSLANPLAPIATGDGPVNNFIANRVNLALGATVEANSFIEDFFPFYVNDGVLDDFVFPWIPVDGNPEPNWVQLQLINPESVSGVVIQGRFDNRSQGDYTLEYTTDNPPLSESSNWTLIGTYTFSGGNVPMPRVGLATGSLENVTGIRLLTKMTGNNLGVSVQEFEIYGPYTQTPQLFASPQNADVVSGGRLTLTVDVEMGEVFNWYRGETLLPEHTGPTLFIPNVTEADAGVYTVVISNSLGDATSQEAVVQVIPPPTFDSYQDAVFSDNPIRYYPLDDLEGDQAEDLGSHAVPGLLSAGVTPGRPASSPELGTAFRFDGEPGTLVDLGVFHPGDNISVEAWINLDTDSRTSYHAIVARWDGSYELDIAPGDIPNFVVFNNSGTFGLAAGPGPIARGQWHHLVGIFSEGTLTIYVNGVQGQEVQLGGGLQDAGHPDADRVMIGATRTGSEGSFNFKGLIDEVAIYDHALAPEKVVAHYQSGLPSEAPAIAIELKAELSWPGFPAGMILQTTSNPADPDSWTVVDVSEGLISQDGQYRFYVPISLSHMFYRLIEP